MSDITLKWTRFRSLVEARDFVGSNPCVYVQSDSQGRPVRVGKASKGLHARYRGGTGWAIDAAMHGSGNQVFVAIVPGELCDVVEASLIWMSKDTLHYNNIGKRRAPREIVAIRHERNAPSWQ